MIIIEPHPKPHPERPQRVTCAAACNSVLLSVLLVLLDTEHPGRHHHHRSTVQPHCQVPRCTVAQAAHWPAATVPAVHQLGAVDSEDHPATVESTKRNQPDDAVRAAGREEARGGAHRHSCDRPAVRQEQHWRGSRDCGRGRRRYDSEDAVVTPGRQQQLLSISARGASTEGNGADPAATAGACRVADVQVDLGSPY